MTNSKWYEIGILPECNKLALEQLLNKLIEKGWKPFGMWKKRKVFARWDKTVSFSYQDNEWIEFYTYLIRDVVSKESWLWQFVCENGYNLYKKNYFHWFSKYGLKWEYWDTSDSEYYVLESALCNEEDLEKFLLDNIKIS